MTPDVWPPEHLEAITHDMRVWEAWWVGDTLKLRNQTPTTHPASGVWQRVRSFWNRANNQPSNRPTRSDMHIPLAADICETSAQLIYGQPPALTAAQKDTPTSQRITQYVENGLFDTLVEGAEMGAALGGRYHRVTWTPNHDAPFVTTIPADRAIPTFTWGNLTSVVFHTTVENTATQTIRHLETHTLSPDGLGLIRHELYQGTQTTLGHPIPLTDHPTTLPLATEVDQDGYITTGRTPGLCVVYFPNIAPQRRWRNHPTGKHLGRSDLDGLDGLLDALDETWNSWMRDIRLGKSRVLTARHMLEDVDGNPTFDLDQELFLGLETPGSPDQLNLEALQFAIRYSEHQATVEALTANILRSAGYSRATFGEDSTGLVTATEIKAREKATLTTRSRKLRLEQPRLEQLLRKLLDIDTSVYNTPNLDPTEVEATFPDIAVDSPEAATSMAVALAGARLASRHTLVQMIHPDWTPDAIKEEMDQIQADYQTIVSPEDFRMPTIGVDRAGRERS